MLQIVSLISAKLFSDYYSTITTVLVVSLLLYSLYQFVLFPPFGEGNKKKYCGNFKCSDPHFAALRARSFPPPFPNGWFKLCDVTDLDGGNVVSVSALGLELVVFQGRIGRQIGVLDAFCPHMGAHLGQGGVVEGDCLKCPFHAWKLGTDGQCQSIPYTTVAVPKTAVAKTYRHMIWMGMVMLWYHADGEEPTFDLQPHPEIERRWTRYGTKTTSYKMHITDMAENAADYFHFNHLHEEMPIPILKWFVTMKYDTKMYFNEDPKLKHCCYFDNYSYVYLFRRWHFKWYTQKVVVTFEGPGLVHFDIRTPLGNLWLVKSNIPRRPFEIYSEDTWYGDRSIPRWLVYLIATISQGALEQDRRVWENRLYTNKPHLVKGDGPFLRYRQWFDQFYSESSCPMTLFNSAEW